MAVLFPGEQAWELWRGRAGQSLDLGHRFESSGETAFEASAGKNKAAERRVVALPVRSVMAMPMWVNAPGEREMHQAAKLQLERSGLRSPNESHGVDFSVIEKGSGSSLILAQGLTEKSPTLAEKSPPATDHVATPFLLPLPPDHLTIWRELGRLVAAITRGGRVVFFDSLTTPQLDAAAIQEVHRMAAQLSLLDMLNEVKGIVLWTPEGDAQAISDATGLPVDRSARPGPVFPEGLASRLEPRSARLARERAEQRARSRKMLSTAAIAVGAVVLLLASVVAWFSWQRGALRNEVADLYPQAAQVEAMRERWMSVAPAVDRDAFVLENLLAIQSIPAAGAVALQRFELTDGRIAIEGSAPSATQALRFLDALSGSEDFADYQWNFLQPTLDGAETRFEITGTREEGEAP